MDLSLKYLSRKIYFTLIYIDYLILDNFYFKAIWFDYIIFIFWIWFSYMVT